ncbi:MAG: peptide ABC transporter substrate-binding protein [Candidatus Pacebacteria bacterium]|nr:peptide ABC transporter substrate-binding protein [Candidatus Paceibacterota bacterium]
MDISPHQEPSSHPLVSERRFAFLQQLEALLPTFSPFERLTLYVLSFVLAVSAFGIVALINYEVTTPIATQGGSLTEGVVGTSRFANPLLATSDTDKDVSALVFSGLMRALPDGTLTPDLADSVEVSEDGTTYLFTLRADAFFHDGMPVTAQDVAFTVNAAQNPDFKSVKRAEWDGVHVEAIDAQTVKFTLPRAYAPFLEATTLGILPAHLWENVSPADFPFHQLNKRPIGSGPYQIDDVKEDSSGAPIEYTLHAFDDFTLAAPFIQRITLHVYANEDDALKALEKRDIESIAAITPSILPEGTNVLRTPLPRVFAVFFNEGKSAILVDKNVRRALNAAVDRQALINASLSGYGMSVTGPLPKNIAPEISPTETAKTAEERLDDARAILDAAGWIMDEEKQVRVNKKGVPLAFSLTTADTPELSQTAEALAQTWRSLGITVTIKVFSTGDLNTTVIRPREYEALLFGEVVGRGADLYAFWHSSQRNDPGLNLSLYANAKADRLLTEARRETDPSLRKEKLLEFAATVDEDVPAIFLYVPEFIYSIPDDLYGVSLGTLTTASERFANVYEWHRETERVWDIFITDSESK